MTRLRGRNAVGERLFGTTPFGRWKTRTFIAGLTCDALIAPWVIEGAMDRAAFDIHAETQLAPALSPGTVFVGDLIHWISSFSSSLLDNLSTHSAKAAEILNAQGCWMPFLPACSPDPNPIDGLLQAESPPPPHRRTDPRYARPGARPSRKKAFSQARYSPDLASACNPVQAIKSLI